MRLRRPDLGGEKAQEEIDLVATTTNGGDMPAGPFTQVLGNSAPASDIGDSAIVNFDYRVWAEASGWSGAAD